MADWSVRQIRNPALPGSSSGDLVDLFLVIPSSNPWLRLSIANWLPPAS